MVPPQTLEGGGGSRKGRSRGTLSLTFYCLLGSLSLAHGATSESGRDMAKNSAPALKQDDKAVFQYLSTNGDLPNCVSNCSSGATKETSALRRYTTDGRKDTKERESTKMKRKER